MVDLKNSKKLKYQHNSIGAVRLNLSSLARNSKLETLVDEHEEMYETYSASGLKYSLHGNIYQLKLLMLFLNRGLKKGYNFRLATEWDDAEKFDDLVFRYTDSQSHIRYRFLQAKHKLDENKKITVGDLLTRNKNGEFNLEKYFISYLRIKKNKSFEDGSLEDFVICTNIDFDFGNAVQDQIRKLKGKVREILVKTISTDDYFFQDGGTRYRLESNNDLISHFTQNSKVQEEINGQSIDQKVEEFLAHLVFAVNQPNEIVLDRIIGREIGEKFKLIDSDLISHDFQKQMLDWMKEKGLKGKEGRFLSADDGRKFFDFVEEKINKIEMVGPTSRYGRKLRQFNVFFKSSNLAKIKNFLSKSKKQVLNLVAQQGTRLSAIKVNQVLYSLYNSEDSFIFMSLVNILRLQDKVLSAFQSKNTGNLLVIECKNKEVYDVQDLYMRLKNTIRDNINKKIILITESNDYLADAFKNDCIIGSRYQESTDNIRGLSDLTVDSQNKILERKVIFQGEEVLLSNLLYNQKDIIDGETLSRLVSSQVAIGSAVPKLNRIDRECYVERTFSNAEKGISNTEEITDKITIIAADPGMGKSTVLTHLAEQEKINSTSTWVVKINLIEYRQLLSKENFKGYSKEEAIDFLSEIINLNTYLDKELFRNSFNQPNKVALFFDGVSFACKGVITFLKALKGTQVKKLWITTGMGMYKELEKELDVFSYKLNSLSLDQQKEFLRKFFKVNLKVNKIDERRLDFCIQKLFDAFSSRINMKREFTASPLQLKIAAKIFQDDFQRFYNDYSQNEFLLSDGFDLDGLYKEFIKIRFDMYSDTHERNIRPSDRLSFNKFLKQRQILALYLLFGREVLKCLCPNKIQEVNSLMEDMKKGNGYVGVVDDIIDGNPKFVHHIFAEYLARSGLIYISNKHKKYKLEQEEL